MIKEIYKKCVDDKTLPSALSREEFLALVILQYWSRYADTQNMFYYLTCTLDDDPSDESRVLSICSNANRYSKKYCNNVYEFDGISDKELIIKLSEEYMEFYLKFLSKSHDNEEIDNEITL
jgi:hypothetical protein